MNLHDFLNVQNVFRELEDKWGCSASTVKQIIQQSIDVNWEKAMFDPEEKALWDLYFPKGKPGPEEYILWVGHAHENGEQMPFLLKE